ncbi:hypothetical protein HDU98_004888 [Podochytrium sp. JEL0797]|nr:hypothetical protein HDU98_004888 [Podochytrium sp. JEL0797]
MDTGGSERQHNCNFTGDKKASLANCKKHFTKLVKKFKEQEMESLCASGTDEEFTERKCLLRDLLDLIEEAESVSSDKKKKKEKDEEICETNSAKIRDAAVKKFKAKNNNMPKKANNFDASDDEPSVPSSTPVCARSGPAQLVDTIGSMADMIKESNEAVEPIVEQNPRHVKKSAWKRAERVRIILL